jgi:hypothetical protein
MKGADGPRADGERPDQGPVARLPAARNCWRTQDRPLGMARGGLGDAPNDAMRETRGAFGPSPPYTNENSAKRTQFRRSHEGYPVAGSPSEECRAIRKMLNDCHAGLARCDALLDQLVEEFIERFGFSPFSSDAAEPAHARDCGGGEAME